MKRFNEELQMQTEELETQVEELRAQQKELEDKNREVEMANRAKPNFLPICPTSCAPRLIPSSAFLKYLKTKPLANSTQKQQKYVNNIDTSGRAPATVD